MARGREATQAPKIAIVALPGAEALGIAGPFDVFRRAELFGMKLTATYDTNVYGVRRGAINKAKSLTLSTALDYKAAKAMDTLLVVGRFETPSIPLAPSSCGGSAILRRARGESAEPARARSHWRRQDYSTAAKRSVGLSLGAR